MCAREAMKGQPLLEGPVVVLITVHCEPPASWSRKKRDAAIAGDILPTSKPDLDNVLKLFADAMNGVVYRDDKQITDVFVTKRYGAEAGAWIAIAEKGNTND